MPAMGQRGVREREGGRTADGGGDAVVGKPEGGLDELDVGLGERVSGAREERADLRTPTPPEVESLMSGLGIPVDLARESSVERTKAIASQTCDVESRQDRKRDRKSVV